MVAETAGAQRGRRRVRKARRRLPSCRAGNGRCSDVENENDDVVSSLVDVSLVQFADLELMPRPVLVAAIERVRREACGGFTRDRKFESTLIRESTA